MLNLKSSFNLLFASTYLLGIMVRRSNSYTNCSIKNPIPNQIIDFNSRDNTYKIQAHEFFNGDIAVTARFRKHLGLQTEIQFGSN